MAIPVNDINILRQYIEGVEDRAAHHGPNVGAVALALVGAIIWRKDAHPIEVHAGRTMRQGTVLWVHIGGQRYAFRYDHASQSIQMRIGNFRGPVIEQFNNRTPIVDIEHFFRNL